jgi:hypothetical protein
MSTPEEELAAVAAILELALYGRTDVRAPRDARTLANEAFHRLRRYERVTDSLLALAAEVRT